MAKSEDRGWIAAANAAAVRLAAEAGEEVDLVLAHLGPAGAASRQMGRQVTRLEESAELSEVAADLAGLLWAECANVPPIATILEEPSAAAALEAVAEARRVASVRLADAASTIRAGGTVPARSGPDLRHSPVAAAAQADAASAAAAPAVAAAAPEAADGDESHGQEEEEEGRPAAMGQPDASASEEVSRPESAGVRFDPTGEQAAGSAAAAILRLGRRLRRA